MQFIAVATLLSACFLFYYYFLDGKYVNKPLVFAIDTQNMQLTKTAYKRGEVVEGFSSVCKTRKASGSTQWTLSNGELTIFPAKELNDELPIGCYPDDRDELIIFPIRAIPDDAKIGHDAFFVGVSNVTISGGRVIPHEYRTETFKIIE